MIRKYQPEDYILFEQWITDEPLQRKFSGPDWPFPVTREIIDTYIQDHPDRQFYVGIYEDGSPYAIGEIITNHEPSPRLARLLVGGSENRGKGLGQKFVTALRDECLQVTQAQTIYLFVALKNTRAIRCYEKCGFQFDETGVITLDLGNGPTTFRRMSHYSNAGPTL